MRLIAVRYFIALSLCILSTGVFGQVNKPNGSTIPAVSNVYTPAAYAGGTPVNYVRKREPMGPYQAAGDVLAAGNQDVKQTTVYLDGLSRSMQTVVRQVTPAGKDLVTPENYDAFGREPYTFMPYVSAASDGLLRTDPFNEQKSYLSTQFSTPAENVFYGKTDFELSPLDRRVNTMAPGNSWSGSGIGVGRQYQVNTVADGIRKWDITSNALTYAGNDESTNIPSSAAAYDAGTLYKNIIVDEAGHATVEYWDKEGRIVLKKVQVGTVPSDYSGHTGFLCTYYIYDALGLLRFVLPPKAVSQMTGWSLSGATDILNELCYRFEYDTRRRLIARKAPGAGWIFIVYDIRDRQVFTQDANMRAKGQWLGMLYDALNRPVLTGMMSYGGNPATLQQSVTTQTANHTTNPNVQVDLQLPNSSSPGPFTGDYQALNSIVLVPGFSTVGGQSFTATIVNGAGDPVVLVDGQVINKSPIPNGAPFTTLTNTYYDDYSWTTAGFNSSYNAKLDAGTNLHAESTPGQGSALTLDLITGTRTRVIKDPNSLSAGVLLATVNFYDDKGRLIQSQAGNEKGGTDISTNLYDFNGKVLCNYLDHNNPGGTPARTTVKTTMLYDLASRLLETRKTINDDDTKKVLIAKNTFDELGRRVTKGLGQKKATDGSYTTVPIETLGFTYNVRGWLKGINSDYSRPGGTDGHWFGMELNYDWGYNTNQLNGTIAGTSWRSKGDGERRSYGYTYDNANRLMSGDFAQYDGSTYADNAAINFDMKLGDGLDVTKAYDANGNILQLQHWGLTVNGSPQIDNLAYSYFSNGNKPQAVGDAITTDNKLGDFVDKNTTATDYGYDRNGNLVTDLNKRINGSTGIDQTSGGAISYNHMNLSQQIALKDDVGNDKGTIAYVYDANGEKLEKIVTDKSVAGKTITTTTRYIAGFAYESKTTSPTDANHPDYTDVLQYLIQEEGRIRYIPAINPNPAAFAYDYFIRDHLGNVRMVLTEQLDQSQYPAVTFENANVSNEQTYYENVDVQRTARPGPFFTSSTNGDMVQLLRKSTQSLGAGKLLKVMAGDRLHVKVDYYIPTATTDNSGANGLSTVLTSLLSLLNGPTAPAALHGSGAIVNSSLNANSVFTGFLAPENGTSADPTPKAYLNILFFDDQFKFVQQNSELVEVNTEGSGQTLLRIGANAKEAPKNGYAYIYVNNESNNLVYFDNLQVTHERGPLVEETHYYPFGLTMAGISDKVLKSPYAENKYRFNKGSELQNEEFSDGSGLEMYTTRFRALDPQLGRWWQLDPKPDTSISPYSAMGNNPILYNDPGGDTLDFPNPGGTKTPEQIQTFMQMTALAITTMAQRNVGQNIVNLTTIKETVHMVEIDDTDPIGDRYDEKTNTIYWNPYQGIITHNNFRLSPATALEHEADHAYDHLENWWSHQWRGFWFPSDPNYTDKEERRVITGSEQRTALGMGEIKPGQVTRTDHGARGAFKTTSPIEHTGVVTWY